MKHFKTLILFALFGAAISGCKKQDVANVTPPLGNEFLTTTVFSLQNNSVATDRPMISLGIVPPDTNTIIHAGNNILLASLIDTSAKFADDTLHLKSNSSYSGTIFIFDQTKKPVDTVSTVIKERENIHLFVYFPSTGLNLTDSITDRDNNVPPLPFGLLSLVRTGAASKGTLRVVLRHQPNVKNGTYTPGSTDLDVTYPVSIK